MVPLSRRLERVITKSDCQLSRAASTERRTTGRQKGKGRKEVGMVEIRREKEQDAGVVRQSKKSGMERKSMKE